MIGAFVVGVITGLNLAFFFDANRRGDRPVVIACVIAIATAVLWLVTHS